ncbi:MAG TPA: hypothetical protein VM490_24250, partial [Armatimonadaceae bacterium]|nr:hypothetical protein [Armatimonadaceae bacterium]
MAVRLGGPVFTKTEDPEEWARAVRALGYRAATCPVSPGASDDTVRAFADAAGRHDVVISEVGAWSNPMSADHAEAKAARAKCVAALELAERIGASCAVNIAGSCGPVWDGPHPDNLTPAAFDRIVETTR